MWKTNWPWQIRAYDDTQFLVRFPPNKKIADLVAFKSINLKKSGVNISFKDWHGELPPYDSLKEVWINVIGIPPVWCSWPVIAQIASSLGVIVNVDWHEIFRSFYEIVIIQVAVRDPQLIPRDRLVEIQQELYLLNFEVDDDVATDSPSHNHPGGPLVLLVGIVGIKMLTGTVRWTRIVMMIFLENKWSRTMVTSLPGNLPLPPMDLRPELVVSILILLL